MIKKILLSVVLFGLFSIGLFCQNASSLVVQTVSPQEIYVGDTAEITYTFYSPIAFPMGKEDSVPLELSDVFKDTESFSITKGNLSRIGNQYQLSLFFIPWRTGMIEIPNFDLMTVMNRNSSGFVVELSAISVASILEKTGKKGLQPAAPPILIPGTIYVVCAIAIGGLLLFILLIRVLMNLQDVLHLFSKWIRYFGYGRNARIALRAVRRLEKSGNKIDDMTFCSELEHVLRNYLAYRFDWQVVSLTSNCIESFFDGFTAGTMPLAMSLQVENLGAIFRRLDYVRFAQGSVDSLRLPVNRYAAALEEGERLQIVNQTYDIIAAFEKSAYAE